MSCPTRGGCGKASSVLLRAVFYAPPLVLALTFAALATYPELAELVTPWLGPASHSCSSTRLNQSACCTTGDASAGMCCHLTDNQDTLTGEMLADESIFFAEPTDTAPSPEEVEVLATENSE